MIEKATIKDISAINEIYNHAIKARYQTADMTPQTISETEQWFHNHERERYNIYVYKIEDKVVAWLSFSPYYDREATAHTAEISYYIHKYYQKQGIGSKLIEFTLKEAPSLGFSILFATLVSANKVSAYLLEKFNFTFWGEMKNAVDYNGETFSILYYGKEL